MNNRCSKIKKWIYIQYFYKKYINFDKIRYLNKCKIEILKIDWNLQIKDSIEIIFPSFNILVW